MAEEVKELTKTTQTVHAIDFTKVKTLKDVITVFELLQLTWGSEPVDYDGNTTKYTKAVEIDPATRRVVKQ